MATPIHGVIFRTGGADSVQMSVGLGCFKAGWAAKQLFLKRGCVDEQRYRTTPMLQAAMGNDP